MRGSILVLKATCIRQPKAQLPSSSYTTKRPHNPHNICDSLIWLHHVPYRYFEVVRIVM